VIFFSLPAMGADGEELPAGSFVVLRAEDGLRKREVGTLPGYSVVLLHGWLQNLDSLLEIGQQLRDSRGVDVLLLDFYAHGRSSCLPSVRMHSIPALVAQVRRVIEIVEWQNRGLVIGGVSMGASVTLHYCSLYPDSVRGLLLVAPSGMPEVQIISSFATHGPGRIAKAISGEEDIPPRLRCRSDDEFSPDGAASETRHSFIYNNMKGLLSKVNLIKRTPEYLVDDRVWSVISERRWPISVVVGIYDILHTPHVQEWKRVAPWARIVELPMTHWWLCTHMEGIHLERDSLWDDVLALGDGPIGMRVDRARL